MSCLKWQFFIQFPKACYTPLHYKTYSWERNKTPCAASWNSLSEKWLNKSVCAIKSGLCKLVDKFPVCKQLERPCESLSCLFSYWLWIFVLVARRNSFVPDTHIAGWPWTDCTVRVYEHQVRNHSILPLGHVLFVFIGSDLYIELVNIVSCFVAEIQQYRYRNFQRV